MKTKVMVIKLMAHEGQDSPFIARLLFGILHIRDFVIPQGKNREEFSKAYDLVFNTLLNARTISKEIIETLTDHSHKMSQYESGKPITILEPLDNTLQKQVEMFLNSTVRIIKDGMQKVLAALNLDIGFLYKKQKAFENGIVELAKVKPYLAVYLQETRIWSERLILIRNDLHEGWMLSGMEYKRSGDTIETVEPQISGQLVSDFVKYIIDRICCFVEEITTYALQARMPSNISITEIPIPERSPEYPIRFKVTIPFIERMPIWTIAYHVSEFEET